MTAAALACLLFMSGSASAATCDQYPGDLWAYATSVKPNFLIIIDTSGSMAETVPGIATPYDPTVSYPTQNACRNSSGWSTVSCSSNRVYRFDARSGNWLDAGFNSTSVTTTCDGNNPNSLLATTGQYIGRSLTSTGGCGSSGGSSSYRTGNWINWNEVSADDVQKIVVAREVIRNLIASTSGVRIGVMIYNNIDSSKSNSEGSRFFTYNIGGATYTTTVKDMDGIHSGTMTNRQALLEAINSSTVRPLGYTPLAESLVEAGQYFRGGPTLFGNTIGISGATYVSPITAPCQRNVIIFITDGMSTSDDHADLKNICPSTRKNCQGDYDGDKREPSSQSSGDASSTNMWHAMDDVAKYLYDEDLLPGTPGVQNVSTYTIGFGQVGSNGEAVSLLQRTADNLHGHGAAYLAENQTQLTKALGQIFSDVVSMDSSFVVPVVPTTPEASGKEANRLYMGFFKTMNGENWIGNLKKYALDASNNIRDKSGNLAVWTDADQNGKDDTDGATLPAGATSGSFRSTSTSYWSSSPDGDSITKGGAGERLLATAPADRAIYTYTGTSGDLTHASNSFKSDNAAVTATLLGVPDGERAPLIDFTRGIDVEDRDHDDSFTDTRSWLFGDVLHSRPLVVNYASYIRTAANEGDCTKNRSVIYVGANDGMLHAVNDCDGGERWAFIPPDTLENLKEIKGKVHTYGVDASPVVYRYDVNSNGVIDKGDGDKAIMLLGTRRGGGEGGSPTAGAYHLLDVTDPAAPVYLWSVSSGGSFGELAESWAEPRIVRMKVGSAVKIVAFLPGGYDNANEDGRYGATQSFSGTGVIYNFDSGSKLVTSSGSANQSSPRGRGLYAVELATIQANGRPSLAASPVRLWGVVYGNATNYGVSPATDSRLTYSLAADVAVLDVNGDGYTDRVYAADLGGGLWRFDVGLNNPLQWSGQKIFSANPAAVPTTGNLGRKVFYKPAVTLEKSTSVASRGLDATIFMGTGDREHPNNSAVIDRIYAVRDRGQTVTKGEGDLVDLTDDALQSANATKTAVDSILASLRAANNYGWYIRLDQHPGEKVLASPTVFNRVVYFTTYSPSTVVNPDPCVPDVGTSRLYAVSYTTGEAVFNFDKTNDTTTVTNTRSKQDANIVMRSDRSVELGQGIASGIAVKGGDILIGTDGRIFKQQIGSGKRFIPLYWGQR